MVCLASHTGWSVCDHKCGHTEWLWSSSSARGFRSVFCKCGVSYRRLLAWTWVLGKAACDVLHPAPYYVTFTEGWKGRRMHFMKGRGPVRQIQCRYFSLEVCRFGQSFSDDVLLRVLLNNLIVRLGSSGRSASRARHCTPILSPRIRWLI